MNSGFRRALPGLIAVAFLAPFFTSGTAHAIPAFARQHKTECSTCHTIFPELTEQGENFRKNSFVWLETKGEASSKAKKDQKKPDNSREFLILSSLPDYVPLSVSGTFDASYDKTRNEANRFDLVTRAIRLQAGGSFNDKLGFWLTYNLYSANEAFDNTVVNAPTNNLPTIEDAFVQARHLFDTPVNLKVGRFSPTLSIWTKTNKTSVASMGTTSYHVGSSVFSTDAPADGVEFNSILKGRVYAAGGAVKRKDQKNLEGYGSVQVKLGGADYEGREKPLDFDNESMFDYLSVIVGGYGYGGTNNVGFQRQVNHYFRYGLEGDIQYKRLRFKLASAFGEDDNAVIDPSLPAGPWAWRLSRAYSAEALYLVGSNVIPSFRYEYINDGSNIIRNYISTIAYAPLQNAKIVAEYKQQEVDKRASNGIINLALVAAF